MVNRTHLAFKANDRSYFALLKKEIHAVAASANFSETKIGAIDIVIAELASNLVKHAGGGQLLVKLIEEGGKQGIEIISIDSGKGIADINRMVADGVSTKNTLGLGLGSIKRLSNVFQVYSLKNWGTLILVRIFEKELPLLKKSVNVEIKSVIMPKPGEIKCGDGFYYNIDNRYIKLLLGDGLGHGPEAAHAVEKAGEVFNSCQATDPAEIILELNAGVRKTRGLVATVAVFDKENNLWKLCGVGNIATKISGITYSKNYTPYNGIVGLNVPRTLNTQQVTYEKGQYIIMCSDGLKSKWDTLKYLSVLRYDMSILASALVKDYARYTDDISAAVCKINL